MQSSWWRGSNALSVTWIVGEYAMPYENNLAIYICRNLKMPLKELWPQLKHYE